MNQFIKDIQEGFAKEADKGKPGSQDGSSVQEPAKPASQPPAAAPSSDGQGSGADQKDANKEGTPATTPIQAGDANGQQPAKPNLSKLIKEQYGEDLTDEDIQALIQSKKQGNGSTGVSSGSPRIPVLEDISDEDVESFLDQNKRDKNLVKRSKANKEKEATAIVKEAYQADLKKQFPKLSDDDIEQLFNTHFYIGEPDDFTEEEVAFGKQLMEREAERLKGSDEFIVDNVRNHLHQQRLTEYENNVLKHRVGQYISQVPRKMTINFGKLGNKELGSFEYNLDDETIGNVQRIMQSPVELTSKFLNDKGELDMDKMFNLLVRSEIFDNASKTIANEYHSRGVTEIEAQLNNAPKFDMAGATTDEAVKKIQDKKDAEEFNKKQRGQFTGKFRSR